MAKGKNKLVSFLSKSEDSIDDVAEGETAVESDMVAESDGAVEGGVTSADAPAEDVTDQTAEEAPASSEGNTPAPKKILITGPRHKGGASQKLVVELEERCKKLEAQVASYKDMSERWTSEVKIITQGYELMESRLATLTDERKALASERDSLKASNAALQSVHASLEESNAVLTDERDRLQESNTALAQNRDALLIDRDRLEELRTKLEAERDRLQFLSDALIRERDLLIEGRDALQQSYEELKQAKAELEKECGYLKGVRASLEEANARLVAKLNELKQSGALKAEDLREFDPELDDVFEDASEAEPLPVLVGKYDTKDMSIPAPVSVSDLKRDEDVKAEDEPAVEEGSSAKGESTAKEGPKAQAESASKGEDDVAIADGPAEEDEAASESDAVKESADGLQKEPAEKPAPVEAPKSESTSSSKPKPEAKTASDVVSDKAKSDKSTPAEPVSEKSEPEKPTSESNGGGRQWPKISLAAIESKAKRGLGIEPDYELDIDTEGDNLLYKPREELREAMDESPFFANEEGEGAPKFNMPANSTVRNTRESIFSSFANAFGSKKTKEEKPSKPSDDGEKKNDFLAEDDAKTKGESKTDEDKEASDWFDAAPPSFHWDDKE